MCKFKETKKKNQNKFYSSRKLVPDGASMDTPAPESVEKKSNKLAKPSSSWWQRLFGSSSSTDTENIKMNTSSAIIDKDYDKTNVKLNLNNDINRHRSTGSTMSPRKSNKTPQTDFNIPTEGYARKSTTVTRDIR